MNDSNQFDVLWAFVTGAALHMGARGYWAQRPEPQPVGLHEFVAENIRNACGDLARHGFAGRAWADDQPLPTTLAECIRAAAKYAGVKVTSADIDAACLRREWKNFRLEESLQHIPCDWQSLRAAAEGRGWEWKPVSANTPLHEASDWAAAIASELEEIVQ